MEKAHPRYLRPGRPFSVSAVPFGPGIDIWRSCRFIGAMMRCLCLLPGRMGRFVPCSIGANHCRLRHIGWETCGHGLISRPRESASEAFLSELLSLFNSPPGSARALLAGTLPLCPSRFASRTPTWRLPVSGHVAGLVAGTSWEVQEAVAECVGRRVRWVSDSGPYRRRIRLNKENVVHTSQVCVSFSFTCVEEVESCRFFQFLFLITRGGVVIRMMGDIILLSAGLGWDNSWVSC